MTEQKKWQSPQPSPEPPRLNESETGLLKMAAIFKEHGHALRKNEAYQLWEQVLQEQIAVRVGLLQVPVADQANAQGLDFQTRAARQEVIKGALIGLRLALNLIPNTIAQADEIAARKVQEEAPAPSGSQPKGNKSP
jgi:hypothetical protein